MNCADAVADAIPTLLFAWIGSAWITILLPLTLFAGSRLNHNYLAWDHQQQQDEYNQYDQADTYYDQEDSRPWWDLNWGRTSWSQGGENHGAYANEGHAPWWYWGAHQREPDDGNAPPGTQYRHVLSVEKRWLTFLVCSSSTQASLSRISFPVSSLSLSSMQVSVVSGEHTHWWACNGPWSV